MIASPVPEAPSFTRKKFAPFNLGLVPWVVLVIGLVLTVVAVRGWTAAIETKDEARFVQRAEILQSLIGRRLDEAKNGLNEIAALHAVTGRLETSDLRGYLSKRGLGLADSGIRGFGVVEHIRRSEVQDFEKRQRAAGEADFAVRDNGRDAPDLFVVRTLGKV